MSNGLIITKNFACKTFLTRQNTNYYKKKFYCFLLDFKNLYLK